MLAVLCWLVAVPVILALCIFSAETLWGTLRLETKEFRGPLPTTLILMPAHNEAGIIQETLDTLAPFLSAGVCLLVVADNCTDDTAQLVKRAGFDLIERSDPIKRGKGYALAFGRDHLRLAPPECVIVIDADCQVDALSIEALAKTCVAGNVVVQASYVFKPDRAAAPKVQISNFAFWLKNVVRQRGAHRLGGPAVLTGTGMAIPWKIFESAPLDTANIVEDLALSIYFTQNRHAPIFLEQSTILSAAANETATLGQRTRWEHGFLSMAKSHGLGALWGGVTTHNRKLFQLGLHLMVPPLALLLLSALAILSLLGAVTAGTGYWPVFSTLAICIAVALSSVFLNWLIEGWRWLSFVAMLRLPLYLAWKIPVYLRLAKGDTVEWTRTERPSNDAEL